MINSKELYFKDSKLLKSRKYSTVKLHSLTDVKAVVQKSQMFLRMHIE